MKAVKITNAEWLPTVGQHFDDYCKKIKIMGMHSPNFYAYCARVVQFGGNLSEFWMVFDGEIPVAFAMWNVMDLPHSSKVFCGAIYSWAKDRAATETLIDEYIKFGQKHNAVWYSGSAHSKGVVRLFNSIFKKKGFDVMESKAIHVVWRKVRGG